MTQRETYLVTGGAGFIGSHIAQRLARLGHEVRVIDNLLTGKQASFGLLESEGAVRCHPVSITDLNALRPLFEGVDYVFHQAALPSVQRSVDAPLESNENNVTGTLNVLVAARDAGVKRVVYAASSSAYGDLDVALKHEALSPRPLSPYAVSKLAAEYYCQSFTAVYGLETVALRYFNVFGPRQDETSHYSAVIPRFITAMLAGQPPTIYGDGRQSRDFTYIDNVVHGNLLAAKAPGVAGEVMNLATGGNVSLLQLVEKLNAILGTAFSPVHAEPRRGDILHSQAAIDKAAELLDYAPLVSFDDGLRRTVAFYQERAAAL
jgi:UDP-glucose 4-epimerase